MYSDSGLNSSELSESLRADHNNFETFDRFRIDSKARLLGIVQVKTKIRRTAVFSRVNNCFNVRKEKDFYIVS